MPNHVHVAWTPNIALPCILRWLKGATANRAKRLLGLDVRAFWQDESYDHWIRSDREMQKVIRYVEWNPVKAGLVILLSSGRGRVLTPLMQANRRRQDRLRHNDRIVDLRICAGLIDVGTF